MTRIKKLLLESKRIGTHRAAKHPWKTKKLTDIVHSLVSPKDRELKLGVGDRLSQQQYNHLEVSFRKELTSLLKMMVEGKTEVSTRKAKKLFRLFYAKAWLLGDVENYHKVKSGNVLHHLSPEDRKWLDGFLRKEYEFWRKFVEDVNRGKKKVNILRRVEMYVRTLHSVYESSKVAHRPANVLFHWQIHPGESCPHCIYLANNSPYTKASLPTVPRSGETKCLSNCNCTLRSEVVPLNHYLIVAKKSKTRQEHLKALKRIH